MHTIIYVAIGSVVSFLLGAAFGREWEQGAIREVLTWESRLGTDAKNVLDKLARRVHNL
jgi:hypothetical protein